MMSTARTPQCDFALSGLDPVLHLFFAASCEREEKGGSRALLIFPPATHYFLMRGRGTGTEVRTRWRRALMPTWMGVCSKLSNRISVNLLYRFSLFAHRKVVLQGIDRQSR